ncbi:biopolymer transporter ExbD [Ruegeria sp. WL0004]|uniref:Biopolymer transporter ExbD n=1 Tax=Ruegeria marisflavi TaxID=2984152 RepID=A0ABT2WYH2_9RHOB|nr:biopolymer transporter ExbD [Ruegeria sp. WL0004]MCU9840055.1 biopolymer transporter ExbD [Ruegeria sp. WL0004]
MKTMRRRGVLPKVTLVPLIDVLFILLFYFMVTSVYLDLDMIPVSQETEEPGVAVDEPPGGSILLRIDTEGRTVIRGTVIRATELSDWFQQGDRAANTVLVLPSGEAPVQALATVMDALARAGVTRTRLVRLEARP